MGSTALEKGGFGGGREVFSEKKPKGELNTSQQRGGRGERARGRNFEPSTVGANPGKKGAKWRKVGSRENRGVLVGEPPTRVVPAAQKQEDPKLTASD